MALLTQSAAELGIRVLNTTANVRLRDHRDKVAARRCVEKAMVQKGEPETVTIDKSGANLTCLDILIATERC